MLMRYFPSFYYREVFKICGRAWTNYLWCWFLALCFGLSVSYILEVTGCLIRIHRSLLPKFIRRRLVSKREAAFAMELFKIIEQQGC